MGPGSRVSSGLSSLGRTVPGVAVGLRHRRGLSSLGQFITPFFLMGNYLDKIEWLVCAWRDERGERPKAEGED